MRAYAEELAGPDSTTQLDGQAAAHAPGSATVFSIDIRPPEDITRAPDKPLRCRFDMAGLLRSPAAGEQKLDQRMRWL